jgi:hypothetical protein
MLEPELSEPAYLCLRRRSSTFVRQGQSKGENALSKEAADNPRKAFEHHTNTAKHHQEAKQYESGSHEKASHQAHSASGHASQAREHGENASRAHSKEHGNKI